MSSDTEIAFHALPSAPRRRTAAEERIFDAAAERLMRHELRVLGHRSEQIEAAINHERKRRAAQARRTR